MNFTSIDFETANNTKAGICAAGIAVFEDDKLAESPYWLVRPPKGCGWFLEEFTENCHGLTWFDVLCTLKLSRRVWPDLPNHDLKTLALHIGHEFNHHHAQDDAEAAGRVLLAMMKHANAKTPRELLQMTGLPPDHFS